MRALRRRERRLEARHRRFREAFSRLVSTGYWTKAQRSSLVELGGARLKRVVFPDTSSAARAYQLTKRAWEAGVAPEPVLHDGNDLWLAFVTGTSVASNDPAFSPLLAQLYSSLWSVGTRSEDPVETGVVSQAMRDLQCLGEIGVLDNALIRALEEGPLAIAPVRVFRGLDYVDPRPDNFVQSGDGLRIVDVESLSEDHLIGSGLAKATLRWSETQRDTLIADLEARGAPDLRALMPFVELVFLCAWQKRCALRGKWKLVDPALFRRHLLG